VTKRYGSHGGIENVSLEISAGESIVVVGPSGSGKTTLLYIYVYTEPWQNVATTGQHRLTWTEGLALAERNDASVRQFDFHVRGAVIDNLFHRFETSGNVSQRYLRKGRAM
jgi:ABC-type phosphate/phosphonate transport system ATPase subunit